MSKLFSEPNQSSQLILDKKYELIKIFRQIAEEYGKISDNYRQKAFTESSWAIEDYKGDFLADYDKVQIKSVGKTSKILIKEYLQTGQVKRLNELKLSRPSPSNSNLPNNVEIDHHKNSVLELFRGIHGVGEITAKDLYDKGCRTLEDTWSYLTPVQTIGCRWYYHLKERIMRNEAELIVKKVQDSFESINPSLTWLTCGSYRRGRPDMGDLDILIMKTNGFVLPHYINALVSSGLIVDHLAVGSIKYMGLCRLNNECNTHRIDLMIVDEISWPYATLYFTGSQELNVRMRDQAISLGLRLNEYRLVDKQCNRYEAITEKDIFDHLQMSYLEPERR